MRIAIIAPSPVPFTIGGAEKLWWGLQHYINTHTKNQCELIKLPTRENGFWDLIESYNAFFKLDLSYFDLVISTKYPAWMVTHPNHILYLQHHLRGLFDTYHLTNEPLNISDDLRFGLIDQIISLIEDRQSRENIDRIFTLLKTLKSEQNKYPDEIFKFPGPFIRKMIHYFDAYALTPDRIQRYYAISKNVQLRDEYFPQNVKVKVVYHPSKVEHFRSNRYEYLFTTSRLDSPKRIDHIIQAMKFVPHNIRLVIVGTGPEEEKLKKLASSDKRIEFLGYLSEENLINLYSDALCVIYIPCDEDYGLITIEGMKSKKPIITAKDSGGSLEFVENNETGFVVDPTPKKLAEKINFFIENKEEATRMGMLGHQKVESITWQNVINELLDEKIITERPQMNFERKPKILVLSTYSCFPPRGGGQHRLYNIYSRLAKEYDVTICSIVEANKENRNLVLENGFRQIDIPQSREHAETQWNIERRAYSNLFDVCMVDCVEKSSEYIQKVREKVPESDIIIFSHPYLFHLKQFINITGKKIIYEAHNSEYLLKKGYITDDGILSKIFSIEQKACLESDMIWTTSEEDRSNLSHLYNISEKKIFLVPNGVDPTTIRYIENDEHIKAKNFAGITDHPTILFIGSWHQPNLEALKFIVEKLAKTHQKWKFLIIGSIKDYYCKEYGSFPENVLTFGTVSELEKYEFYKLADIAINPMFSGSGTNLKMLDYMSAGIPVITTPTGSRGLCVRDAIDVIICESSQFASNIQNLLTNKEMMENLRSNARKTVEDKYTWDEIAATAIKFLHRLEHNL
jgi:glycosyltransferase involved in cell wall biosynthesis